MTDIESMIRDTFHRQKIWEVLLRYTRGVDRLDRELILSAFHPDALIDQGTFKGDREHLADWVLTYHRENQKLTQHLMTNHYCELADKSAHTETHVFYYGTNPKTADVCAVGRYIDLLEYRDGMWAISDRICTTEGSSELVENEVFSKFTPPTGSLAIPTRDRTDPSYLRPLVISRG